MKLETLVPVTYNNGIATQETGIVTGTLFNCQQDIENNIYSFLYQYTSATGFLIKQDNFSMTEGDINAMYEAVKGSIPNYPYCQKTNYMYYLGFTLEMANTFGISSSNIKIVE